MSFNNQNYMFEEYKIEEFTHVPEARQSQSFVVNQTKIDKKFSICSHCLAYQENENNQPYHCKNINCGLLVKQPVLYEVFQCADCYSNILHQPQSTIICSKCQKVVKWSDSIVDQASQLAQQGKQ